MMVSMFATPWHRTEVPGTPGAILAPKTADDDCFTDVLNWILDTKDFH